MKNIFKFRTLESRIYATFTLIVFTTIFILQLVSYRFTIDRVQNTMLDNSRAMGSQLSTQIDSYILGMENLASYLADDSQIQTYLREKTVNENDVLPKEIVLRLMSYTDVRDDISHIIIISPEGDYLASSEGDIRLNSHTAISERPWFLQILTSPGIPYISTSYVQNLIADRYTWVVSLSRGILDNEEKNLLGIVLIDLKFNRIKELCQSMVTGEKGYNFIVDSDGNYIYHPFQQLIYSGLKSEPISDLLQSYQEDNGSYLQHNNNYYYLSKSTQSGWSVVSVIQEEDIASDWTFSQIIYSSIGLVLFLIIGFVTDHLSKGISGPVRRLQEVMKSVDSGVFNEVGEIQASFEIQELAREYDVMVGRIRELMTLNVREQEQKRKSDLKALQAQINPHFLYNTLDSIIWMSEMGDNKAAIKMTSSLSRLFRISISKGQEFILVRDEIDHVESYLKIQKMRYQEKFDYSISVEPDLYEESCLKIILQPLVENAIYHGIKEVDRKGTISISVYTDGNHLCFQISDNGCGMDDEAQARLTRWLSNPLLVQDGQESNTDTGIASSKRGQGTGVRNVHDRIRLYYGKDYGVHVSSKIGEGSIATITIPLDHRGDGFKEM